jgi:hypothetical protein
MISRLNGDTGRSDTAEALLITYRTAYWMVKCRWFVRCEWQSDGEDNDQTPAFLNFLPNINDVLLTTGSIFRRFSRRCVSTAELD